MKLLFTSLLVVVACLRSAPLQAQIYETNNVVVQTFAGSGFSGYVDGVGQQTMFGSVAGIAADSAGNLFLSDGFRIRKIAPDGTVSTFAGGGSNPLPGYGTNVNLGSFVGPIALDRSNNLWFVTSSPDLVRISADGFASVASDLPTFESGQIVGICSDSRNNIFVSSSRDKRVYRFTTTGVFEVFVGSGNAGLVDGNGIFCSFSYPKALACDSADNIYVFDHYRLRRINHNRDVSTVAGYGLSDVDGSGTNISFSPITGLCVDGTGSVILASDTSVRKLTVTTNATTLAGSFTQGGYTNGPGYLARFNGGGLMTVCFSQGKIYVADSGNYRIRSVSFDPVEQPVSGADLALSTYPGLRITGTVGRAYRIESSTNMAVWGTETTLLLTSSPYLWIDQTPAGPKKFYRAVLLP